MKYWDSALVPLFVDEASSARLREVQHTQLLRDTALWLLRVHPLRGADAVQLASAVIASDREPATLEIVSLDVRLAAAARREGFAVVGAEAA